MPCQRDVQEESLRRGLERLQRKVEAGLTPQEGRAVYIRLMARAIKDTKAAHDSLNAKVFDSLAASQRRRTQNQAQVWAWFEEWQAEVDIYTDWIFKWEDVLEEAVENHGRAVNTASHPVTNTIIPVQQIEKTCPKDKRIDHALFAKEMAMIAPTAQKVAKIAPAVKFVPELPHAGGLTSSSPLEVSPSSLPEVSHLSHLPLEVSSSFPQGVSSSSLPEVIFSIHLPPEVSSSSPPEVSHLSPFPPEFSSSSLPEV